MRLEIGLFELTLTAGAQIISLIAHLRRVAKRRATARGRKAATVSRPPVRDPRQASLLESSVFRAASAHLAFFRCRPTPAVRTLAAGQYEHIPIIVGASAEDEFE